MRKKRRFGKAFGDQLIKVNSTHGHFHKKFGNTGSWEDVFLPEFDPVKVGRKTSVWRIVVFASLVIISLLGLTARLFFLQVVHGAENRGLADSNRVQVRVIHAPRGVIYDRNGKILAQNNPGFRLKNPDPSATPHFQFVTRDDALKMEATEDPQFANLEVDSVRYYPFSAAAAHVLGYLGEISEDELKDPQYVGYKLGDRIGRAGVESSYEKVLKGKDGAEIIEVDAQGKRLQTLRVIEPVPGNDLHLSIDADLQKETFEALAFGIQKNKVCCGAAVAEDPATGQILSLASYPSYDANALSDPTRSSEVEQYFTDPHSPFLNRATSGVYPPGSTFKIASALAGLSSKQITKDTIIQDTGVMHLGPYSFANWYFSEYGRTEGPVDIIKALQRSNDIYFYQLGATIGVEKLSQTAKLMGLGKKIGVDLPGEEDGLIGDDAWKQANYHEVWYPGDTLHMAIGQGYILATPLQIMSETAFIANNGLLIQPHVGSKITAADGRLVKEFQYKPIVENLFDQKDIELVKQGLSRVPKGGGTAWPFFTYTIPTAGKTGTAEFGDPKNKTHAWYTSYAPEDHPQIALTVLVEAGGEGSNVSAPISKQIYNWYFSPDKVHVKNFDSQPVATESAKLLGE
jgi:penicillin-binding protein 2